MLYLRPNGYPKSRQTHDAIIDRLESSVHEKPKKPSVKVLLIRVIVLLIYLCLGALVFKTLEEDHENNTVKLARQALQKDFNLTHMTDFEKRLKQFERLVKKERNKDWDYYQSLYFASSVTTTIGYGHITPQTQSGRLFLIVFALIGIPLNILALASVGEHITMAIYHFLYYVSVKCFSRSHINHINIKVMLISIFLMIVMLYVGGWLYCSTEDWSYIDSIYYCFVAMATIGFGDLVPNDGLAPDSDKEKAIWFLRSIYLSIGLSLVSTVFTALSNAMEEINILLKKTKTKDEIDCRSQTNNNKYNNNNNTIPTKHRHSNYGGDSEKISYRHKIKKQGNVVFNYKFFQSRKKKRGNNLNMDWDSLLEESQRKDATRSYGVSRRTTTSSDGLSNPPIFVFPSEKDQTSNIQSKYRVETVKDTGNVSSLATSKGGISRTPAELEQTVINLNGNFRLKSYQQQQHKSITRIESRPIQTDIHRKPTTNDYYKKRPNCHKKVREISKNYQGSRQQQNLQHCQQYEQHIPENMQQHNNLTNHHQQQQHINYYMIDYTEAETPYNGSPGLWATTTEQNDYEIMLNQC